jgi:hypothetical protein
VLVEISIPNVKRDPTISDAGFRSEHHLQVVIKEKHLPHLRLRPKVLVGHHDPLGGYHEVTLLPPSKAGHAFLEAGLLMPAPRFLLQVGLLVFLAAYDLHVRVLEECPHCYGVP